MGDFNGDGSDDLLCHDVVDGRKWIDYANASGELNGTDWSREDNWCDGAYGQLMIGDFNGDESDDLLCHHTKTGAKWVDLSNAAGEFNGTDWDRNARWCNPPGAQLH